MAIFAEITEKDCVDGRMSLQCYLLSIIFKFNCKFDFTMMKFV